MTYIMKLIFTKPRPQYHLKWFANNIFQAVTLERDTFVLRESDRGNKINISLSQDKTG